MISSGGQPGEPLRVHLWSGPRNVSTALMYSFAERGDTRVVDEPLYAHYLRFSGAQHPGRDEVLAAMDSDAKRVIERVILEPDDHPVLFFKQMAHHLAGLDWSQLDQGLFARGRHVLLIRDPREVLTTLVHQIPKPALRDTGLDLQVRLLEHLATRGVQPTVLDSRLLLKNPALVLAELCRRLGIAFEPSMLSWPAGARSEDGVWARHWYHNVHRSTGFNPYRPKDEPLPAGLDELLAACQPLYRRLRELAIDPET